MANKYFIQQTSAGDPIAVDEYMVYPVARSYRLSMPGIHGGIIWNRPHAVIVEDSIGNRQVIPVADPTRRLQLTILGAAVVGTLLTWLIFRKSR
jgi:hypothetical protein